MKKRTRLILVAGGVLLVALVCVGLIFWVRGMMLRTLGVSAGPTEAALAGETPAGPPIALTPAPVSVDSALPTQPPVSFEEQPCYNLLYPLSAGTTWTYAITARGTVYNVQMSVPSTSGPQAVLSLAAQPGGFSTQSTVDCDLGGLQNLPLTSTGLLLEDILKGSLSLERVSGQLSPTFAALDTANWNLAWSGEYLVSGTAVLDFQGNEYSLLLNNAPLTISCQTAGSGLDAFQSITVLAGTYDAMRVTCTFSTLATAAFNSFSITGTLAGQLTEWYAPYVGLVRLQPDFVTVSSASLSLPVSVANSGIELIAFQTSP